MFNFLYLYEIRGTSYLALSWRDVLVRERSYEVCLPSGCGGKAGSELNTGHVFPWVCLQLLPWWEVGLEVQG